MDDRSYRGGIKGPQHLTRSRSAAGRLADERERELRLIRKWLAVATSQRERWKVDCNLTAAVSTPNELSGHGAWKERYVFTVREKVLLHDMLDGSAGVEREREKLPEGKKP